MDHYVQILSKIAEYVHKHYPDIQFSTTLTMNHGILNDDKLWQATKNFSDMLSVTYWPLNADFTVVPNVIEDVDDNIKALLSAAKGKPIIIKEAGLPTSLLTNSSETLQAEFIKQLFLQTRYVDQIKIVGWDFLADYNQSAINYWSEFQQIDTPEFRAYIGSLGLMDALGNLKPGYSTFLNMLDSICTQTSIKDTWDNLRLNQISNEFTLSQNYPNPFNPVTTIRYSLNKSGWVKLILWDTLGKKVKTLVNAFKPVDTYKVEFDASNLASGVYYYQLQINTNIIETHKMVLLK
jgi:hypothetical protein